MVLPKLTMFYFVLYSFFYCCIGDDLQWVYYGFCERPGWVQCEQGNFLCEFLLGMLHKMFEMKHSHTAWSSNTPTFLTDSQGIHFNDQVFCVFFMSVFVEMLFMLFFSSFLFFIDDTVQWAETYWMQSILYNGFSAN